MRGMRRICYTIFSVLIGGCTPIGGIPNDAPVPAAPPSQAVATIAAPSTIIDARIAALCQQPGTRMARPAPMRLQCRRLLPSEGAARATAAEGDIERRNEAAVVARVVASARARCSALGRSRSVVWPLPALVPANRRGGKVFSPAAR